MSSKQGPRVAGMRAPAKDASHRIADLGYHCHPSRGRIMSSKQGPRVAGMRAPAKDASHRIPDLSVRHNREEEAA